MKLTKAQAMKTIQTNTPLAPLTSFRVGGSAQFFLEVEDLADFEAKLDVIQAQKTLHLLGGGSNVLISDEDLRGLTLRFTRGRISYDPAENLLLADGGSLWDDLVCFSLQKKLWGIELMSGIPGTVGGATAININAYGQSLLESLKWVKVYDRQSAEIKKQPVEAKYWGYKKSPYSSGRFIVLQIALKLEPQITHQLHYPTALDYAQKHGLDDKDLASRRKIILGTRALAGSLLNETPIGRAKTCGSFFKNPLVDKKQVEQITAFDETGFSQQKLKEMNRLHGGQTNRISAAHILLAAGFYRGQTFGRVRLHPSHVLKIENYRQAQAIEIYQVALFIQQTVKMKLGISLEFEVSLLGEFGS